MKKIKKNKKSMYTVFYKILIILGILIFLYPIISTLLTSLNHSEVIKQYSSVVQKLSEEQQEEELEKARIYNESLIGKNSKENDILVDDYNDILNISGNGIIAYINIPKINVYLPIYHGTDDITLTKGIGHVKESSFPIGETSSHCILTGHTGLPSSTLFTNLNKMEVGDIFYINVLNQQLTYKVYEIDIVLPEEVDNLQIEANKDLVTLITCTPYGVNTHRLLVRAERIEKEEKQNINQSQEKKFTINIFLFINIFWNIFNFISTF